jgi:hypothetical protein
MVRHGVCGQVPWPLIAWVAWGALCVHRLEHGMHAARRLDRALQLVPDARKRNLITPSCGSGRMSVGREHELAIALYDAATHMRAGPAIFGRGVDKPRQKTGSGNPVKNRS